MTSRTRTDVLLLAGFCAFLFFYGAGQFGLIGADEPRYAQVAREMLDRHDWITPTLHGHPWLEKPPLYYWQAMLAFSIFGVTDTAARIPSAVDATLVVVAIYLFFRRFRHGVEVDAALITASCAGVVGYAHAASTDMVLAAAFAIGMLCWWAWRESDRRIYLALFYFFMALGMLAKGPVAPFLAAIVIFLFAAVTRDWWLILRTLWFPGLLLFCVIALPWYLAVQMRNPQFFHEFILEQNVARFSTNLYHHPEPFWYFVPVVFLALMPWTIFVIAAFIQAARVWWAERTAISQRPHPEPSRFSGGARACPERVSVASESNGDLAWGDDAAARKIPPPAGENAGVPDDAAAEANTAPDLELQLNVFACLWLIVPVIFFSLSQSKLPGYILPAVPAGAVLLAEYLRRYDQEVRISKWMAVLHGVVAAAPIVPAALIAYIVTQHHLPNGLPLYIALTVAIVLAAAIALTLMSRLGLRMLRFVTLIPVVLAVAAVLKLGTTAIDQTLSARPLEAELAAMETHQLPLAVCGASRELEYGLAFYRHQKIARYELGETPSEEHLLVANPTWKAAIADHTSGRRISLLGHYAPQNVDYYWVGATTQAEKVRHEDEDDIREQVFLYLLTKNKEVPKGGPYEYYLSLGQIKGCDHSLDPSDFWKGCFIDPSDSFMAQFAHRNLRVHKASECRVDALKGVVSRQGAQAGMRLQIDGISWLSDTEVMVGADFYQNTLGAGSYNYTLKKENSIWVVTQEKMTGIA